MSALFVSKANVRCKDVTETAADLWKRMHPAVHRKDVVRRIAETIMLKDNTANIRYRIRIAR